MSTVRTARLVAFVAPAEAAPQVWRLGLGLLLAGGVWTGTTLLLALAGRALGVGPRLGLVLGLSGFAGLAAGVWLAARVVHRRRPVRLVGPDGFRWREAVGAAAAVGAISLVALLLLRAVVVPWRQLGVGEWLVMLPLAIPAIVVQASAEELAFRGYLMQALAARFRAPLIWALGPAALFGLLHWDPQGLGWAAVAAATVSGLVLADVTVRTGSLSAAIGLHVANNLVALLVVSPAGPLGVLSLWVVPGDAATDGRLAVIDVATTLAAWGVWRIAGRRLHSPGSGSI